MSELITPAPTPMQPGEPVAGVELPSTVLERTIATALAKLEAERKAEAEASAMLAAHKAGIARRVSIAALLLTMMLSFLGFVRAQSGSAAGGASSIVQQSRGEAATEWALYQTKIAQRSGFIEAQDVLSREVLSIGTNDPRRRLARFHHHEYEARVRALDEDNRQVFHRIQSLESRAYTAQQDAAHQDRRNQRYDTAIRTLTLGLVLISVTLLVDSASLFYFGLLVAAIGAAFGVSGYFLR